MFEHTRRNGVTLVELLIVIAILGLLMQLFLPAVEASREAARRSVCQNQLRQIALAALSHESTHGFLPTAGWGYAWVGDPDRGVGKDQPGSFVYQLLPYLEASSLYGIGQQTVDEAKYEALSRLAATPLPLLYCPSRRLPRATPTVDPPFKISDLPAGNYWYNAKRSENLARSDYKANIGDFYVFWGEGPPPSAAEKGEGFVLKSEGKIVSPKLVTGVIMQRQPVRFAQIADGLSKTYMIGEKYLPPKQYKTGADPTDDQSCWNGDDMDQVAGTLFSPRPDASSGVPVDGPAGIPFGSAHPSIFSMVLCDGSIMSVNYDVDREIHRRMGNRQDGDVDRN
jgi:prepilin-type N-terminal cleavage/methylation domain-containing protein